MHIASVIKAGLPFISKGTFLLFFQVLGVIGIHGGGGLNILQTPKLIIFFKGILSFILHCGLFLKNTPCDLIINNFESTEPNLQLNLAPRTT